MEYGFLAGCYDAFTKDVHYPLWADYLEQHFQQCGKPIHTILDLACGTGTLSCLLAERGYEMIGVDRSPDMLAQAMEKSFSVTGERPLFLCQSMDQLDLYGTIDACVCMLDSVNHVMQPDQLRLAFQRVHLFLEPDGLFLFDCFPPERLQALDGGLFIDETEDAYCVWRTEYQPQRRTCTYAMDIFQREGEVWVRDGEFLEEYAYTLEELTEYLTEAGFCSIQQYGNLTLCAPQAGEERIFFTARKKGY